MSSHGPWASPIVLVNKKDGFCVNFWKLNDCIPKEAQPLPKMDDSLDVVEGSHSFSSLDIGRWQ